MDEPSLRAPTYLRADVSRSNKSSLSVRARVQAHISVQATIYSISKCSIHTVYTQQYIQYTHSLSKNRANLAALGAYLNARAGFMGTKIGKKLHMGNA